MKYVFAKNKSILFCFAFLAIPWSSFAYDVDEHVDDTLSSYKTEMSEIYYLLHEGRPEDVQQEINQLRLQLQENFANATTSVENRAAITRIKNKLDWYQVLLYERNHQLFKAKHLLRNITHSDSPYNQKAKIALKKWKYRFLL